MPTRLLPDRRDAVLIADAGLFTAAAFVLLIFAPPAALLAGPAAAWRLHGRRLDRPALVRGAIGLAVSVVTVLVTVLVGALLGRAIGPVGGSAFAAPIAVLGAIVVAMAAVVVALDVNAVRDLLPDRRRFWRLAAARLGATAIVVVFAVVVAVLQARRPASEIGDAGVFAVAAAAAGGLTMAVACTLAARHPAA